MRLLAVAVLLLCTACPDTSGTCKGNQDCPKGRACCEGTCRDIENDRNNCGGCGAVCETPNAMSTCRVGRCQFQCSPGWGNCNQDRTDGCELDLTTSADNCGLCGRACTATNAAPVCSMAICGVGACQAGYANCDTDSTNGCEIDTRTDSAHCGGCNQRCSLPAASSRCEQSTCVVTGCDAGFGDCDDLDSNGCEVALGSAVQHCGACNRVCAQGQRCGDGRCKTDELIVFGGSLSFTASTVTNEVYRFDLVSKTFTQLSPATPDGFVSPRRGHVAAWDEPRNRMVMWGGIDGAGTPASTDTWALDFNVSPPAWRKLATTGTPPSARFNAAAALDARTGTWYLFGGSTDTGQGLSDLHTLDLATGRWSQVHASGAPNAPTSRVNAMAAFEPTARAFLVLGGTDPGTRVDLRELWRFDVATRAWSAPSTSGPSGRGRGAFFDGSPAHLFSGIGSLLSPPAFLLTDFQSLSLDPAPTWTPAPAAGPEPRFHAAHVARDGTLYLFAGGVTDGNGQRTLADLWGYELSTRQWTRLFDGTGAQPAGKLHATLVGR